MERLSAVRLSPAGLKAGIFQPRLDDVFPAENPNALVHLLHSLARFERRRPLGREFNLNLHWSGDNTGLELCQTFHGTLGLLADERAGCRVGKRETGSSADA